MRKIILILAVISVLASCKKETDEGQKYCWQCISIYGEDVDVVRNKTEDWAKENVKRYYMDYTWKSGSAVCNELIKTDCP